MARDIIGNWQIVEMDLWDLDAIELLGPASIEFNINGTGHLRFIAVEGYIDWKWHAQRRDRRVDSTWDGYDEGDPVFGTRFNRDRSRRLTPRSHLFPPWR